MSSSAAAAASRSRSNVDRRRASRSAAASAQLERVDRVEQVLLVLLQVLVVGQRQAVQHAVERRSGGATIRGAFARSSSAASGFFFCGMMLEPDAHASASSQKPNSSLDQSTISAPSRDRWVAQVAAAPR